VTTSGIEGLLFETHNWGKSVAFWQGLGYQLELETDHHSGRLRHPGGGPWIFVAERPASQPLSVVPALSVGSATAFVPPKAGKVRRPFTMQHWGVRQMLLLDPDGRELGIEAPLREKKAPRRRRSFTTESRGDHRHE
jgi:hypothetical protein